MYYIDIESGVYDVNIALLGDEAAHMHAKQIRREYEPGSNNIAELQAMQWIVSQSVSQSGVYL